MQRQASLTKHVDSPKGFDAHAFAELMEKAMAGEQGPVFKKKKSFSPSVIGYGHGTCPRYWHIAFDGAMFDDSSDAVGMANMKNGSFVHDRLQAQMAEALGEGVELEREINSENPPIRGFVDVIANFGTPSVGEIKSAKQEIFDQIAATGKPLPYHIVQLLIYLRVLGISEGFFYYENKNTQQFIVIPVTVNEYYEKYTDQLFEWMTNTHDAFKEGKLAKPITPKRKAKECRYCPLVNECLSRGEGDIELPVLKLP